MTAHDHGEHNGFLRMYAAIRHLYLWVGMKRDIQFHTQCFIKRIPILSHVWKRSMHAPKQTLVTSNEIPWY